MEKIKTIKKINLFKNLEDNEIAALLRCFSLKFIEFRERKKIANRLDRIDNLYIVLSGAAREAWYNEEGDVITYIDYREGDIIGLEYVSGVVDTKADASALNDYALTSNVYTKTEADEKFLTEHQSLSAYYNKEEVN